MSDYPKKAVENYFFDRFFDALMQDITHRYAMIASL